MKWFTRLFRQPRPTESDSDVTTPATVLEPDRKPTVEPSMLLDWNDLPAPGADVGTFYSSYSRDSWISSATYSYVYNSEWWQPIVKFLETTVPFDDMSKTTTHRILRISTSDGVWYCHFSRNPRYCNASGTWDLRFPPSYRDAYLVRCCTINIDDLLNLIQKEQEKEKAANDYAASVRYSVAAIKEPS